MADYENMWFLTIVVYSQRLFGLLLINARFNSFLVSFGKQFAFVNFKAPYLRWFFELQLSNYDMLMKGHRYNNLGWLGYETGLFVHDSAGALFLMFVAMLLS